MVSVRTNNNKAKSSVGLARSVTKGIVVPLVLAATVVSTIVSVCNPAQEQQRDDDYALLHLRATATSNLEFAPTETITPPHQSSLSTLLAGRSTVPTISVPNNKKKKQVTGVRTKQDDTGEFVITFVGDTMFQNTGFNWETQHFGDSWNPADGFQYLRPLLNRTDFLIMNLEGPITDLPITTDVKPRSTFNFSFGMHPRVAQVIKDLGVDAVNLANNHQADRNMQGWADTKMHLDRVGIRYFGSGLTTKEQAEPLMIDVGRYDVNGTPAKVGITGFMEEGYCCDEVPVIKGNVIEYPSITLRPTKAKIAMSMLEEQGATVKIAFPHWIGNYLASLPTSARVSAQNLANAGYDLIIGSDGSHTVKEFDFITAKRIPCFFDIGNFLFQKWGRFQAPDRKGKIVLPYGSVTNVVLGRQGKLQRLEIFCTMIDNNVVHYQPRPCTPTEAAELFSTLGPHLEYKSGDTFATVSLKPKQKLTKQFQTAIPLPSSGTVNSPSISN